MAVPSCVTWVVPFGPEFLSQFAPVHVIGHDYVCQQQIDAFWELPWYLPLAAGVQRLIAIIIHGIFNQFFIPAVMTTAVILLALPLLMIVVFERSERATRQWLGVGFDTDREVLEMLFLCQVGRERDGVASRRP